MDPVTAMILISAGTALMGKMQADKQASAVRRAQRDQEKAAVKNQNQLVEESYGKRRQALGLGMAGAGSRASSGLGASQSGTVLTSVTGEASILG